MEDKEKIDGQETKQTKTNLNTDITIFKETVDLFKQEIATLKDEISTLKSSPKPINDEELNKIIEAKANQMFADMVLQTSKEAVPQPAKPKLTINELLWKGRK